MKIRSSCGFVLADDRGWLLCHVTNGGNRWDLPKGEADPGEDHRTAAIRELFEETNLILTDTEQSRMVDLGQHSYQDHRDLHLFYLRVAHINQKLMKCTSMVENPKGDDFPEMDGYAVFPIDVALTKVSKRMSAWLTSHVPEVYREPTKISV